MDIVFKKKFKNQVDTLCVDMELGRYLQYLNYLFIYE